MALSTEQRAALQARAAGLRQDVSSIQAETEAALNEKSQEINDAKLMEEVERLELAKEQAVAVRDNVKGGTPADAIAAMNAVAGVSATEPTTEDVKTEEAPAAPPLDDPFATEGGATN